MNHIHLRRAMKRAKEIASEKDVHAAVVEVFKSVVEQPADAYLTAFTKLEDAEDAMHKETREAQQALDAFKQIYATCRSVLRAHKPDNKLPARLDACPTDTDKVTAVERMLHVLEGYKTEKWAQDQLAGDFGTNAPKVIKEVQEAIDANKAVSAARDDRASTSGLAYEKLIAFKRVVRDACGPSSKQYTRIHIRRGASEEEEEPGGGTGGSTPGPGTGTGTGTTTNP
jgi:hypothetical protein